MIRVEFDSVDEFQSMVAAPHRDLIEANASKDKAWEKLYAEENKRWTIEEENRRLKEENARFKQLPPSFTGSYGETQIRALLTAACAGQKIQAIKVVREMLGLGLKESKDLVEQCGVTTRPLAANNY